jgi:hypothetical protein
MGAPTNGSCHSAGQVYFSVNKWRLNFSVLPWPGRCFAHSPTNGAGNWFILSLPNRHCQEDISHTNLPMEACQVDFSLIHLPLELATGFFGRFQAKWMLARWIFLLFTYQWKLHGQEASAELGKSIRYKKYVTVYFLGKTNVLLIECNSKPNLANRTRWSKFVFINYIQQSLPTCSVFRIH